MAKLTDSKYVLKGKSGTEYSFGIYSLDTSFNEVGGVYIFTKRVKNENKYSHTNIYIGKTDDLSTRFNNHHKKNCISQNKANCICVKQVDSEKERTEIETDLLLGNSTPCNEINN